MLNGMGLSGLQFVGADIGGIVPVPSPELYTRWMQTGLLTPFAWTHSLGPGNLEPWGFGNRMEGINRESIKLRYRLLPYIYTAFWQAAQTGQPIMRPLLLEYPDDWTAIGTNDEYLFGNDLLVAPIVKDYDESRSVYFPRGTWYDYWTDRQYVGPITVGVSAPLERMPLFVRGGAILPSQQDMEYTDQFPIDPLTFDVYPEGSSSRDYYDDDGISFAYQKGVYLRQTIKVESAADRVSIEISDREGTFHPPKRSIVVKVHLQTTEPHSLTAGGVDVPRQASAKVWQESSKGWMYDVDSKVAWIRLPDEEAGMKIVLLH